ncbi:hypothetical protein D3C76_482780 [compost metagenome]
MYPKDLDQRLMINCSPGNATNNLSIVITKDHHQRLGSFPTDYFKIERSEVINKCIKYIIILFIINFYIHCLGSVNNNI